MKARMRTEIKGAYYLCSSGKAGYENGVAKGDIVDLQPEHVLRELLAGRVDLRLDGPLPLGHEKPSAEQILDLQAQIAAAQREPAGLRDKVSKIANIR
jgi:hypothetical protein